ncbi:hypothetical protein MVLG_05150 [Microbotryum lychnidis-dioicae p1A1 Lamole]|uniref:Calcineurin subunit B n=1 Tax=Microbotryum lychnidis-dioicae (strain p1A1 Lamole / MvSl-1064) TaxID=683840 RepID=U5HDD4_USTV1|nr:hypothetical protein MVLG_05150 [Microbotryum lychnidis-dioicae p1A1 Lamole]|eukprot:KDE04435.1 hypothetical protein MVLG_05150 [Microbotryum lychnidis-dioicae p1A1 Lamole]
MCLPLLNSATTATQAASLVTNPFDLVKVRQQLQPDRTTTNWATTMRTMFKTEGPLSLYKGLSASMLREMTYSGLRMGAYDSCKAAVLVALPWAEEGSFATKLTAGMTSGMLGAAVANPADLLKVRMQSKGAIGTLRWHVEDIVGTGGVAGLYRAIAPTVLRAGILTASQLGTYDHAKHTRRRQGSNDVGCYWAVPKHSPLRGHGIAERRPVGLLSGSHHIVSQNCIGKSKMGAGQSQLLEEMEKNSNFSAPEIQRLKKRFMKLDKDGSGSIDKDEFLQIPQIANNPLASRMIAIFDEDGGGTVDFQEFVAGLSAFSSRGEREEKLKFAFKVYDMDRDGYISNGELFLVLKMMVGNNLKASRPNRSPRTTIMEADRKGVGKLDFEDFKAMVANTDIAKQMTLEGENCIV